AVVSQNHMKASADVPRSWLRDNPVRGTTDWTRREITFSVPNDAVEVHVGVYLFGEGKAWFDTLSLEVEGVPLDQAVDNRTKDLSRDAVLRLIRHRTSLHRFDPEASLEDRAPIGRLVGEARLVALGEATHGTSEFFRMKHRLIRFLVEEKGFRTIIVEGHMPELFNLNRALNSKEGD